MSDVQSPYSQKRWVITDKALDALDEHHYEANEHIPTLDFMENSQEMWECPECGRLAFIDSDSRIKWYKPAND